MPRDLNGNYTLPAGNPVVTGTVITSTWANGTMTDVGDELTDSLSRSGKGGFTAPVGIVDKSGSVPGLNFVSEPTSGFKREASEDIRMQVTTTDVWQGIKTGVKVLTPNGGGVLKHPVVEESGQKVLRGVGGTTVIWFYSNTVPPGYTIEAPDVNLRNLSIAPGGAVPVGGGTIAGADDPSNLAYTKDVTPAGTIGAVDVPHTHTGSGTTSAGPAGNTYNTAGGPAPSPAGHAHTYSFTTSAPTGATHDHPFTGTANSVDVLFNPRRAMGVLGKLDA